MIIIEIAGHLGADPETRVIPNGNKVTVLRIATNIRQGDKDDTIWWEVSFWGSEFDNMIKHLKKGSAAIVIGEMQRLNIYTDKEGRPQVGYRMTGRMLKFSPFGKSERSSQEQNSGSGFGSQTQRGAGPGGYSEHTGASSFGSGQPHVASYTQDSEDNPPF